MNIGISSLVPILWTYISYVVLANMIICFEVLKCEKNRYINIRGRHNDFCIPDANIMRR